MKAVKAWASYETDGTISKCPLDKECLCIHNERPNNQHHFFRVKITPIPKKRKSR